ncbi:MAG TPA: 3-phosphoshikimate 1-carboxyvinyltransferase, partial [Thermomicrobiales bacterium]|nr:3-phosphoshikimate 1-carboxyvinyltransferase [Thermomicrobiales bacterium]
MRLPDPLEVPVAPGPISGRVTLPGSKSYTNRALPIAALADGLSTISGALDSDDTRYMVDALSQLGIQVEADWTTAEIRVSGQGGIVPAERAELYLGNSGTSMRFLTALATLAHGDIRLDGTERMRERPLAPLIDGLAELGVNIRSEADNGCPPVNVRSAGLPGGTLRMRGDISSQYFSAVSMILPYAQAPLMIEVLGELVSKPYIDMTAGTMAAFGVTLQHDSYQRLWVEPGQHYHARRYVVEPDASAASYFFALAAVTGGTITVEHLPPSSRQGDLAFVDVLEQMGCTVERRADDVTVTGAASLGGIEIDMNAISDTVPTLAAIAPFASEPVTIRNVAHIRVKETDRIAAVVTELRRMNVDVDELDDGLVIRP